MSPQAQQLLQLQQQQGAPPGMTSPMGMGGAGMPGAAGAGNPMMNGMMGPAGAIPGQPTGVGMPGGQMGAGGMQALMQGMQGGGMQGGGGMPPMVPPTMSGGPNTPPPEEEGQGPGKLAPFLPRRR